MRLLFITNDLRFFRDHRASLVAHAKANNHEVHICYGVGCEAIGFFKKHGNVFVHQVPMDPHNFRLLQDFRLVCRLRDYIVKTAPDLVHTITIKPNLYGSIAVSLLKRNLRPALVMTYAGLGKIFEPVASYKHTLRRIIVENTLRLTASRLNPRVTFENPADAEMFQQKKVYKATQTHVLMGSGIDLKQFHPKQNTVVDKKIQVLFASRTLSTKGTLTFIEAAIAVHAVHPSVKFVIAGDVDQTDQDRVDVQVELTKRKLQNEKWLIYLGAVPNSDIPTLLRDSDIVCLPTKLREGFPRVLIEAAACGSALIASDQPAIRQILKEGENGWLINPFDQADVNQALIDACSNRSRLVKFGEISVRLVNSMGLSKEDVTAAFFQTYNLALSENQQHE